MFKSQIINLIALVLTGSCCAQNVLPISYDTLGRKQDIILNASGQLASTNIPSNMLNYFLVGGEIPSNLLSDVSEDQQALNRVGFYAAPTLIYSNYQLKPFKKMNWGMTFKVGAVYSGASRYQGDFFGLVFRGNEPYLGTKLDLSNQVVGFFAAHKIGFGLINFQSKSSVTLNVYGITNYLGAYTNESYMMQDESGFNAELQLNGEASFATGPFYKGIGVGVDANLFFKIKFKNKPSFLRFSIQNLGVGFIKDNIIRYQIDTVLYENGYTISDLTNGTTLFNKDKNLAEQVGVSKDTISKTIALPFTVQLGKIIDEHNLNRFQLFYGAKIFVQNGSLPMLYLGGHFRSKKWFRMGLGVSYGGYAGFRANLYVQARWEQFHLGIGTTDLIGSIGLGNGYSCAMNLSYRFN